MQDGSLEVKARAMQFPVQDEVQRHRVSRIVVLPRQVPAMVHGGHHVVQRGFRLSGEHSALEFRVSADPLDFLWVFQKVPPVVGVAAFPPSPLEVDGS